KGPSRYRVQQGDTLARLAERYGVTVQALASLNRVRASASLRPGRTISVPESAPVTLAAATPPPPPVSAPPSAAAAATAATVATVAGRRGNRRGRRARERRGCRRGGRAGGREQPPARRRGSRAGLGRAGRG